MDAVWDKIEAELDRRRKQRAWLGRAIGATDQAMNNWRTRGVPAKLHKPIADDFGWSVDQLLDDDWTPEQHSLAGPTKLTLAQNVSHIQREHEPHIEWGELMHADKLPRLFWATLQDDAMAPRAPSGRRILFDKSIKPEAGDGVLIADKAGIVYFRLYRAGAGARWTAHALNQAFGDLDSEHDGLRVLAVLKAEEGRWK